MKYDFAFSGWWGRGPLHDCRSSLGEVVGVEPGCELGLRGEMRSSSRRWDTLFLYRIPHTDRCTCVCRSLS
jgi:hypothetical protein